MLVSFSLSNEDGNGEIRSQPVDVIHDYHREY